MNEQKNPFGVPPGYLPALQERLARHAVAAPRPRRRARLALPVAGWAATLALIVLVARWITAPATIPPEPSLDNDFNPTREEIIEYLTTEADLATLSNDIILAGT
ncbi:MAG: hypothetical protein LBI96_04840 [Odoribacteraceae bacterium]|jgi:hypothetical protein|nr:hypothetical protein [Odoribacteraceae bacterium]